MRTQNVIFVLLKEAMTQKNACEKKDMEHWRGSNVSNALKGFLPHASHSQKHIKKSGCFMAVSR